MSKGLCTESIGRLPKESTSLHAADAVQQLHIKAVGNAGKYRITTRKRPGVHQTTTPRGA